MKLRRKQYRKPTGATRKTSDGLSERLPLSLAYDYLNDAGVDSNELLSLAANSASIAVLSRMGLTEEALPDVQVIETIEYDDIILLGNASTTPRERYCAQ